MAIVVDLQLGRSLLLPSAHTYNAVVELLDEARRGARDHPGDLAHLPAVRLSLYIKIIIPTYSRRPPLTENVVAHSVSDLPGLVPKLNQML